jgi:hypothetical protein
MDITLAGVVLFLHIGIVICSFMIAGFLHAAFHVLPRARTIAEMRPWAALMHRLEPLLPILAIGILGMGAWLVHLEHGDGVRWSDGWVLTPLITLVVVEALAGALLAPRTKVLCERVAAAPDGAVPDDIRQLTVNPLVWNVGHVATFGFFGIVFVMTSKPAGSIAWVFPVVGAAIGLGLSRLQLLAAGKAIAAEPAAVPAQRKQTHSSARADH